MHKILTNEKTKNTQLLVKPRGKNSATQAAKKTTKHTQTLISHQLFKNILPIQESKQTGKLT